MEDFYLLIDACDPIPAPTGRAHAPAGCLFLTFE